MSKKIELKCPVCNKIFLRYQSTIRPNAKIFCSRKCQGQYYKDNKLLVGKNNPNYKNGKFFDSYCICGLKKDSRSTMCSQCSRKSYPIGTNGLLYDLKTLKNCIINSKSIKDVSIKLNTTRTWVRKQILYHKIDISHFIKCGKRPHSIESLVQNSQLSNQTIKRIVIENDLLEYQCNICNQDPVWNGVELVLDLHHKDGNKTNNTIENLQILCPNCHSQTETFKGGNYGRRK